MTQSASQAAAWRTDVRATGRLWTVEDDDGVPAPITADGRRAMPFWSTRSRVEKLIAAVPDYEDFRPRELTVEEFGTRWLDGLERDGLLVGINWSGAAATGQASRACGRRLRKSRKAEAQERARHFRSDCCSPVIGRCDGC
jgi:hypothetical protein